ncbi:MAG: hypothetical protein IT371_11515 [Deltaproteobacteria bacterium]|nr:hypothetical protein [Deltaproteobacteria bacterium]
MTKLAQADFDKRFLSLVVQTDTVITAANVAYHLNLPIEEAQEHLLSLELNGTLQQATDQAGNTYYVMPNRPAPGTAPAHLALESGQQPRSTGGLHDPAALPRAPIYGGPGAAPAKGRNVNGLVLNVLLPGVGSLVCGRMSGLGMLGLLLLGVLLFFFVPGWSKLVGILPILGAWIWSIAAGVGLLSERESGPGIPG